ncbi:MAG: hypothetical protein JNL38_20585 [Myxococcales bacterium]|nr:hypothetical protein [Myxococcales bacterium]
MRPRRPLAIPIAALAIVGASSCRDAGREARPSRADGAAPVANLAPSARPAASASAPAAGSGSAWAAASSGAPASFGRYFSLQPRSDDETRALEATYDALPTAPVGTSDGAVVLCRIAVVEPAPRPKSAWDRANGRDLALGIFLDGHRITQVEGPLGQPWLVARVDDALAGARPGARVTFELRDRDQDRAYPYVDSIPVGALEAADGGLPAPAKASPVGMSCRSAPLSVAAEALLPAADRALAAAEAKATWPPGAPPPVDVVSDALRPAVDAIRVGEHLAQGRPALLGRWREREERLAAIARRHDGAAREAHAKLAPAPVGAWVDVGPSLAARVGAYVCPPVPKGADPGPLNDDQREGCGLVLELKSPTRLRFDANPAPGPACRMTGEVHVEVVTGPGTASGVCVLGIRRGAAWLKQAVDLSPSDPTVLVLGGAPSGLPLRIRLGDATAVLATPPAPE